MIKQIQWSYLLMGMSFFTLLSCTDHKSGKNSEITVIDSSSQISITHKVTLPQAHIGDLEIDTMLLDSYTPLPQNIRNFYLEARDVFYENPNANFTNPLILESAQNNNLALMGGPLLGKLDKNGLTIWLRPSTSKSLEIKVNKSNSTEYKSYLKNSPEPGIEQRIEITGLAADTEYNYAIYTNENKIAGGSFKTPPDTEQKGIFRLTFGSDFHKIGLHNPNLINTILKRKPQAMMLLGDNAVDDRDNKVNMHRSDYLLRDISKPWIQLAANIPLYSCWDDHDYFNNDKAGIPEGFNTTDRDALREIWFQNWNNPNFEGSGIYFNTVIGPVEVIMLDSRSCRENSKRGEYGSYLGIEQLNWLIERLKKSKSPFKLISSGTMWSDYISNGKDSWGTWDTLAREEIFKLIESEKIPGVIFLSGDRHGARGFTIPRSTGFEFYEFEAGTLGGVPGPAGMAKDTTHQLFGYDGTEVIAFGEFTFDTKSKDTFVTFRLVDEFGKVLEELKLPYERLVP
ncbi:alkaline phosphatase D family protein [Chondrinema litorale]|uniref:alkaline phosphatase D family protein n=1 Tax=Chondrinema litorale TaxID=2994555 RepID=UPI0025427B5F|nr:alkaline phosphatase D family protein [Chondrinema litorale]UZR97199.1 alkaline phosphatase D family protein [Chondrinema litorale]